MHISPIDAVYDMDHSAFRHGSAIRSRIVRQPIKALEEIREALRSGWGDRITPSRCIRRLISPIGTAENHAGLTSTSWALYTPPTPYVAFKLQFTIVRCKTL